ncbi:RNA-processing protein [Candidatus Micrarchaeota archaeon]|nr:RNA-processing protein [Candidatus Micrarchaeota archaeon]
MIEIVRIPTERIGVLIGEKGATKAVIEKKCNVRLNIDEEGDVEIDGESTETFFAKDVVKAMGRGFTPHEALKLIEHDYNLYIIQLKELIGSDKAIIRLKGRVIGENGRMKGDIESATESIVCIYGNTIGIIARIDTMDRAKEAIMMLLDGAPHAVVINYLAKARREIMESRLKG